MLLGVALVTLEEYIGMPSQVLYGLAGVACVFAIYSFSCYFFVGNISKNHIRFIAFANLAYCIVTAALVLYLFEQLTALGLLYFIAEILVLVGLVTIELKTASAIARK